MKWVSRALSVRHIKQIEIETASYCNRRCPTCIRNSTPNNKELLADWFVMNKMPTEHVLGIVQEMYDLGFRGSVNLSRFNEPLCDDRLAMLGREVKKIGHFGEVKFHSNGDLLTEELATDLDGIYDRIIFGLYDENSRAERKEWIESLFKKTVPQFVWNHVTVHYDPRRDSLAIAQKHIDYPCDEPIERVLINHRGELTFCCEEVTNQYFNFGSYPEKSMAELLSNEHFHFCIGEVKKFGGRRSSELCSTCPR
jgi:sulfatase maturation enzyme AslB (radical SAM superfamily)